MRESWFSHITSDSLAIRFFLYKIVMKIKFDFKYILLIKYVKNMSELEITL